MWFLFSQGSALLEAIQMNLIKKATGEMNSIKTFPIGLTDAGKILLLMYAITYGFTGFADAANNTSAIYAAFIASLLFKEKIKSRLFAIIIMMIGVVIIILS